VLSDAVLGDDVLVEPHCVVVQSRLDDSVVIGRVLQDCGRERT